MFLTYLEELLGEGFTETEFGMMVAGVFAVALIYILVKTVLGWFREVF